MNFSLFPILQNHGQIRFSTLFAFRTHFKYVFEKGSEYLFEVSLWWGLLSFLETLLEGGQFHFFSDDEFLQVGYPVIFLLYCLGFTYWLILVHFIQLIRGAPGPCRFFLNEGLFLFFLLESFKLEITRRKACGVDTAFQRSCIMRWLLLFRRRGSLTYFLELW